MNRSPKSLELERLVRLHLAKLPQHDTLTTTELLDKIVPARSYELRNWASKALLAIAKGSLSDCATQGTALFHVRMKKLMCHWRWRNPAFPAPGGE